MNRFEQNADRDTFEVRFDERDHKWRAEQVTGVDKNYLQIPASLWAISHVRLISELMRHRRSQ